MARISKPETQGVRGRNGISHIPASRDSLRPMCREFGCREPCGPVCVLGTCITDRATLAAA